MGSTTAFRKSSKSEIHGVLHCVEVGAPKGAVAVRDTKEAGQPRRTTIKVSPKAWGAFTASLR